MNINKMIFKKILFYTLAVYLIFQCIKTSYAEEEEKVYRPYPVVFVHGFNSNRDSAWSKTIKALKPYYAKYDFTSEQEYFPYFSYGFNDHGDCRDIVWWLKTAVNAAIISMNYMKPPVPESKKKVIIVCHSFGGLVSRYMLNSLNQKYVYKTLFIGTPHIGSPLASAGWLVYDNTKKDSKLRKDREEYNLKAKNINGELSNLRANKYYDLVKKLDEVLIWDEYFIKDVEFLSDIKLYKPAIEQMRVPSSISCETELESSGEWFFTIPYKSVNLYDGSKTFLAKTALTIPNNKRTLWGTGGPGGWLIQKFVNEIISDCPHTFNGFPYGHSLGDLSGGDGIVTYKSQTELGKEYRLLWASHIEETSKWKEILTAIDDDPPEITGIRAVPKYWLPKNSEQAEQYYIIVGCKEYLLADVEVMKFILDGEEKNPFADNKPYNTFGKEFLKEREDPDIKDSAGKPVKLKPGEFYVLEHIPSGVHTLQVQLRNPSQKLKREDGAEIVTVRFSRPKITNRQFTCSTGEKWTFDAAPLDVTETEKKMGDSGLLSFTIQSELFKDMVLNVAIYDVTTTSSSQTFTLKKSMISNKDITLKTAGKEVYQDGFPSEAIPAPELTLDGDKCGLKEHKSYLVRIAVRSKDMSGMSSPFDINNKSGRQGLFGSNWDNSDYTNDTIRPDPTFVQFKRELDIPLGLTLNLELQATRLKMEDASNGLYSDRDNIKLFLQNYFMPILEELAYKENNYFQTRQALMNLAQKNSVLLRLSEYMLTLLNYDRQISANQTTSQLKSLFQEINHRIPGISCNKFSLSLKYKHSISTTPINIDIQQEKG